MCHQVMGYIHSCLPEEEELPRVQAGPSSHPKTWVSECLEDTTSCPWLPLIQPLPTPMGPQPILVVSQSCSGVPSHESNYLFC